MKVHCLKAINTAARIVLVMAAMALSMTAQARVAGEVVEVIDGKTVVIDIGNRSLNAEIRYIEIPEPGQELRKIVRDHLEKLTLGKKVEFRPHGFSPGKTYGQLFVGELDVAVQMLRDGAAWHVPAERSGQNPGESEVYGDQQEKARSEKRGVWGVSGLVPAWEFRDGKAKNARQGSAEAEAEFTKTATEKSKSVVETKGPARRTGFWSDTNPWLKNPGPLMNGYNAASRTGYVRTSFMDVKEQENQPADQKTAIDITYQYKQNDGKSRTGTFVLTVVSSSSQERFLKANSMTISVDEKNYTVGKPKRTMAKEDGKLVEKLTYELNKTTVEKIVYGGDVFIKISEYTLYPTAGLQLLLYNMLQVAG